MAIVKALQAIIQFLIRALGLGFIGYTLFQHGPELSETVAQSSRQVVQAAGNVAEGAGDLAKDAGGMGGGLMLVAAAAILILVRR